MRLTRPPSRTVRALTVSALVVAGGCVGRAPADDRGRDDTVVSIDFEARDSAGRRVDDLRREECRIFENGVEREVSSILAVGAARTRASQGGASARGAVADPFATRSGDGMVVVVIDDLHLGPESAGALQAILADVRHRLLGPGVAVAMVSTGPASIALDLSYDFSEFDRTVARITGGALERREAPAAGRVDAVSVATIRDVVSSLERIRHRRKVVILVSDGVELSASDASAVAPLLASSRQEIERSGVVWSLEGIAAPASGQAVQLIELASLANRNGVRIVSIRPDEGHGERTRPQDRASRRPVRRSTEALAGMTGGWHGSGSEGTAVPWAEVASSLDSYEFCDYRRGTSPRDPLVGIELRVSRPGVRVTSHRWYATGR